MTHTVAVRALCEFTARCGDLDLRFTPAPSGEEGVAGHTLVRKRRGAGYESEIGLSGQHHDLLVRGRADGYDPTLNQLEEIKTYRGRLEGVRPNQRELHWAQAKVYAHLLCLGRGLDEVQVALVYFNVDTHEETMLVQPHSAADLAAFFSAQCALYLGWARQEAAHRSQRDQVLTALEFPLGSFRAGQRALAVAAYRAARTGGCVLAQAPTGIGKTLGTLFPVLKAMPDAQLDKLFFLTAKGPGRQVAMDALAVLQAHAQPAPQDEAPVTGPVPVRLRVLNLPARQTACEHPDKACHGQSCPLAQGFYDRLPAARLAALQQPQLDLPTVRAVGLEHRVCPYYLSQELARWCDVVVADYNQYYDASALLHAMTQAHAWRAAVLVDEAHNLLARARSMYTSALSRVALQLARQEAVAGTKKALDALARAWQVVVGAQTATYADHDAVPASLLGALHKAVAAIGEAQSEQPLALQSPTLNFYFEALHFLDLAEAFGPHAVFDITLHGERVGRNTVQASTLCIRNVIPAPHLEPRHAAAHATVLFSGTLAPQQFYRDVLGLPDETGWIDVPAPFRAEQLAVHVVDQVSTRYRDRDRSVRPIADLIARQFQQCPGNYLSFLSSFAYLQQVAQAMRVHHPEVPIWLQHAGMDAAGREDFLAQFREGGRGVGFAVLGGAFSEGVDLPGSRLIGAFIATLGLPQVNPVNDTMMRRMAQRFGERKGHDYAYLYPGLQKVVQAAGRVIRAESDQGSVHLIDDRFRQARVKALLPTWWAINAKGGAL